MSGDEGGNKKSGYRLEYASSARAKCKGPKPCAGSPIAKGELRVGSIIDLRGNPTYVWRHWGCTTPKILENMKKSFSEASELDGYEDLEPEDQAKIDKAWDEGQVADEDIPATARKPDGDAADEGEEKPKRKRAPPKKKAKKDDDDDEEEEEEDKPKKKAAPRKRVAKKDDDDDGDDEPKPKKAAPRKRATKKDAEVDDDDGDKPKKRAAPKKTGQKKAPAKKKAAKKTTDDESGEDFAEEMDKDVEDEDDDDAEAGKKRKRAATKPSRPIRKQLVSMSVAKKPAADMDVDSDIE